MERADERIGKATNTYLNHYVAVSDAKAGAVATISLVVIGFVVGPESVNRNDWISWLGVILATASALAAGMALYPRTPHSGNGNLFWGDITSHKTATDYWKSLNSLGPDEIGLEYARQNHNVSRVLVSKMALVRRAIWLLGLSFAMVAIAYGTG